MATVYLIGRAIDQDRTVRIHCHIDTEDQELLPGMYLSALVETGGALVPALPNDAVIGYQGKHYIFIVSEEVHQAGMPRDSTQHSDGGESQHFSMVEIQTSNSELGYTEVTVPDSLSNSDIVVKGAYSILSKMKNSEEEGSHAH